MRENISSAGLSTTSPCLQGVASLHIQKKINKKMDVFTGKMAPLQIRPTKAELHSDVACSVEKGHQNVFNFENEYSPWNLEINIHSWSFSPLLIPRGLLIKGFEVFAVDLSRDEFMAEQTPFENPTQR